MITSLIFYCFTTIYVKIWTSFSWEYIYFSNFFFQSNISNTSGVKMKNNFLMIRKSSNFWQANLSFICSQIVTMVFFILPSIFKYWRLIAIDCIVLHCIKLPWSKCINKHYHNGWMGRIFFYTCICPFGDDFFCYQMPHRAIKSIFIGPRPIFSNTIVGFFPCCFIIFKRNMKKEPRWNKNKHWRKNFSSFFLELHWKTYSYFIGEKKFNEGNET